MAKSTRGLSADAAAPASSPGLPPHGRDGEAWRAYRDALRDISAPSLGDRECARIAREAGPDCAIARAETLRLLARPAAALAVLRAAWRHGRSRSERAALTLAAAALDPEFQARVATADFARDNGRWAQAQAMYEQALELYPLHHGYRVQCAHMFKEQSRWDVAEIHYRSGLALGAPPGDVAVHLEFVRARQGLKAGPAPESRGEGPLDAAPSLYDLEALAYALWGEARLDATDALELLRTCATCEDAAARMIGDPRFGQRNGLFLNLLSARA